MMRLIRYPHHLTTTERPYSVVTIGNFDGLHRGHQALITKTKQLAQARNLAATVVTFQPLAAQYFSGENAITLLTPFKHKAFLLQSMGLDQAVFLNFNHAMARLSAEAFAQRVLFDGLQARHIVVGDDFRFGHQRRGNTDLLRTLAAQSGVVVETIPSICEYGLRVSSSLIRQHLKDGDLHTAQRMLGRPFSICGRVRSGRQLGRTLGMPTINLAVKSPCAPVHGVFAVRVKLAGGLYPGVASLGRNPTVANQHPRHVLEAHLFDFDQDIYGQVAEVLFMKKLRDEVKFDGLTALKQQMHRDARAARAALAQMPQEAMGD